MGRTFIGWPIRRSTPCSRRVQWHRNGVPAYRDFSISSPNPARCREGKMPEQEPSGEVPGVTVSGSHGIQIGSGHIQNNSWVLAKQPPDPVALSALNPHTAVVRLQQLPDDELVDFFARAKPDDVTEIIEAFLEVGLDRLVAALGDINRCKATKLIMSVAVDTDLGELPEAAEAIVRKAAALKWTHAGPLEFCKKAYARRYDNGRACWVHGFGVHVTNGAIDDMLKSVVPGDWLAIGNQEKSPTSPFGTDGIRQEFLNGTVYS
jgi:hypothetical protein